MATRLDAADLRELLGQVLEAAGLPPCGAPPDLLTGEEHDGLVEVPAGAVVLREVRRA